MSASAHFVDSDGATAITLESWPDALAGVTQVAKKFGFANDGSRAMGASPGPATGLQMEIDAVGANDGSGELRIAPDSAASIPTLSPPYGLTAVVGPAGGAFGATGVYGWRITATNATGETVGSVEATLNVTDATKKVTLAWTTIAGATGYKVYRTPTAGTYGASTLRATLGATGTYDDDGSATSAGTPPAANTTGGAGPAYGTPPSAGSFVSTPLQYTTLAIGQHGFFWVNRVVPANTTEQGNTRQALTTLAET